jgi:hypothetical protein
MTEARVLPILDLIAVLPSRMAHVNRQSQLVVLWAYAELWLLNHAILDSYCGISVRCGRWRAMRPRL